MGYNIYGHNCYKPISRRVGNAMQGTTLVIWGWKKWWYVDDDCIVNWKGMDAGLAGNKSLQPGNHQRTRAQYNTRCTRGDAAPEAYCNIIKRTPIASMFENIAICTAHYSTIFSTMLPCILGDPSRAPDCIVHHTFITKKSTRQNSVMLLLFE